MRIQFDAHIPQDCMHCPYEAYIPNCPCNIGKSSAWSNRTQRHPDCPITVAEDSDLYMKLRKARKSAKRWKTKYLKSKQTKPVKSNWILCSDRKPEYGVTVLVCTKSKMISTGALLSPELQEYDPISILTSTSSPQWVVYDLKYAKNNDSVVAWMPYPEPIEIF